MKLSRKMKKRKAALCALLGGVMMLCSMGLSHAEEQTNEYSFDPVLITAMRRESKDLKTAAAVQVVTEEQIKETGAANMLDVLQFSTGITADGYGARGGYWSGMTAGVSIRGMGKNLSALVLLNGVPLSLNGKYGLENIPSDSVERVEIVKGAASTLYGSSAMGGVINIITKQKMKNSASVELGSFGTNRETLSLQAGKISLFASMEGRGNVGSTQASTDTGYHLTFPGDKRKTLNFTWTINDAITWMHNYSDDEFDMRQVYDSNGALRTNYWEYDVRNTSTLQIRGGSWLHKVYYNGLARHSLATVGSNTHFKLYNQTYGIDSQATWGTSFGKYAAGFSWQKDTYLMNDLAANSTTNNIPLKQRDLLSVFGQIDHPLSKKTNVIFGGRADFILQQSGLNNYTEFSPQLQILHALNKEQSLYINAGRSFRAPNWSSIYLANDNFVGNPDLAPDVGYTYELGWKKIGKADSLKVALYKLNFDNLHKWVKIKVGKKTNYQAQNAEFRNLGLELEYARSLKNGWGYKLGANFGNPESKEQNEDWLQSEAKMQLTSGITYSKGKWSGSVAATYIANRQLDNDAEITLPPSLVANLMLNYDVEKNTHITLRVENLLDRTDIVNGSYYTTPGRAFYLKLTRDF